VGPTRGENQRFHTRAKERAEKNECYGALEGHSRNEDSADRLKTTHINKEERKTQLESLQEQET
jgi:hypothetical protein